MCDEVDARVFDDSGEESIGTTLFGADTDKSFPTKTQKPSVHQRNQQWIGHPSTNSSSYPGQDRYKMTNRERGIALIINNKKFEKTDRLRDRTGTDYDAYKTYDLLDSLGFEMIIQKNDCTVAEMKSAMRKVSSNDFSNKDCFVCFILSYGEEGCVYGSDGRIQIDELIKPMKGDQRPSLAGKPKLFFIQTCKPSFFDAHDGSDSDGDYSFDVIKHRIPVEADILVVQSNISGSVTWNSNNRKACIFIETLFEAMKRHRGKIDMLRMMTRVCKEIAINFPEAKLPSITSTLTKDLYLTEN